MVLWSNGDDTCFTRRKRWFDSIRDYFDLRKKRLFLPPHQETTMTRNVKYAQCAMRRIVPGASVVTTSYIPTQFAKVGRVLKLKDSDDRWVDGWVVEAVGDVIVEGERVPDYRKAIGNHRKSTGDSTPRLRA